MTQWEYRIVPIRVVAGYESAATELNFLGENGWELVSVNPDRGDLIATFKRPGTAAHTSERARAGERELTLERERETRRRGAA